MKIMKIFRPLSMLSRMVTEKTVTMALVALAVLAGGNIAVALGYHEYENPPCYDITGSTTAFLVDVVNNGGIMNFDDAGVDLQYQACVRMSAAGPTGVPQRLEGWVWNDNLGWISLYCPASGFNLGVACGAQQYGVTFNPVGGTSPDFTTVTMSGAGWGENIGYINFNSTFHQMQPTPNGDNRGLVSASSPAAQKYAWADSVGWLDFSGVKFRWEAEPVISQPHDVMIWDPTDGCNLAAGCLPTVAQIPVADASEDYTIEIPFKDGEVSLDNTQVRDCGADFISMYASNPDTETYCARVKLEWSDDVDLNQTTLVSQNAGENPYGLTTAPGGAGAVIKPLIFTLTGGDLNYNALKKIWGANVSSYAPTSDRNIADGMQLEKFNYADTTVLPDSTYAIEKTDQNRLRLAKVNLMLFKYSTGTGVPGQCIMGEIKDPSPITSSNPYTCNPHTYIENVNMPFKPLVEITKLVHKVAGKELNFINIENVEAPQYFDYKLAKNAATAITGFAADFYIGLATGWNYLFQFEVAGTLFDEQTDFFETDTNTLTGKLTQVTSGSVFSTDASPYLFSTIRYKLGTKDVSYFANKLPRIAAGILKNPVALVQGNVYLTDYAAKTTDVSLRSLGNISSNLRREQIYRNVQNYLRGYDTDLVTGNTTVVTDTVTGIANLNELVSDKVFYLKNADLTIDCEDFCNFDGDVTFIVENGNIFVDSDIVPAPGKQVGLIALRNLNGNVMTQGFVNVDKDVKWLSRVHVFADRVLQSYDKTASNWDTNGFYCLVGDDLARQNVFKHQLVFEGTMSSMNGIGNASANPATDELGTNIGGVAGAFCTNYNATTLAGICRARVVDLNYLRYYGPGLEICTGEEGVGAVANVPRDQQLKSELAKGYGCNPEATGYNIDASALFTDKPDYGDLISGGVTGGLQSGYFSGKPAGLKNEFPVNFFYVPISENLGGFEREQEFNPVIQ